VGASCLFIGRSVSFLKQFIRANKNETIIQKALVASAAIQFLITMLLLFKFHLGIISVFVAVLVATLTEYLILISYTRTSLVRPETYFSWQLLKRLFKRFAIWDYVSKVLNSTLFYGGLFIATFFLGYKEIAILTIVLSLCNRILDVFSVVGFHLSVIYSSLLARRQLISLRQVAIALNYLLVNLMVVVELLLLTVGNVAYEWYFGKQMEGSYYIFLLIAAGFLAIAVSISPRTLVYVADIRLYTRITILSVSLFVALLVLLGKAFGLAGVAFAYFFAYFLRSTMFYLFSRKFAGKYPGKIRKDSIIVSAFLLALLLLGRGAQLPFAALVKVYLFIIALGLITLFNHSDIRKALNFLNSKI
jgi:O-antigen/teichoic acid export membrane protein